MNKQKELARLWDGERREMLKQQYATPEEHANRFKRLVRYLKVDGLWLNAAVGTGTPALVGLDAAKDDRKLLLSDGDAAFLQLLRANYPGWQARQAFWQGLPAVFGKKALGAVEISGNSMPYASGWNGSSGDIREKTEALEESLAAVFAVLEKCGKFVFDLARYGQGRHEIGKGYFLMLDYRGGLRYWTVGNGKTSQTRTGLILDIGAISGILRKIGFAQPKQVPPQLQLDPLYYELYFAEKK
jgi:hypothetical protein